MEILWRDSGNVNLRGKKEAEMRKGRKEQYIMTIPLFSTQSLERTLPPALVVTHTPTRGEKP